MIGFDIAPEVMEGMKGGCCHELDVGLGRGYQKMINWSEYGRGNYVEEHLKFDSLPLQPCKVVITVWVELVESFPSHPVFDRCH